MKMRSIGTKPTGPEREIAKKMYAKGYRYRVRIFSYDRHKRRHYEIDPLYVKDIEGIRNVIKEYKQHGAWWDFAMVFSDGSFGVAHRNYTNDLFR